LKVVKVFKENKQFTLFSILALIVVGVAVFAPQIAPYDPLDAVMLESLQAPSSAHPFGTDKLGRDLLSRVIFGTRTSLVMTLCLVAVIFVIGTFLGVIAGYFGGIVDGVIMRIADMMISFPGLVLAIAIAGMLGPNLVNAVISIAAVSWTKYARLARSMVLKVKKSLYIEAAVVNGTKTWKILLVHVLPNMVTQMVGCNSRSRYRNHDAGAGIFIIPWLWCYSADTGMGADAERGKNLHGKSAMADDLSRYRNRYLCSSFQYAW